MRKASKELLKPSRSCRVLRRSASNNDCNVHRRQSRPPTKRRAAARANKRGFEEQALAARPGPVRQ
eukprot:2267911-Alexandrium_andersonii.AAC.1